VYEAYFTKPQHLLIFTDNEGATLKRNAEHHRQRRLNLMEKEELKLYLKDYLEEKGISTTKPFKCLSPEHEDNNPSMSYDRKRNIIHCFSCGKTYNLIDLVMLDENLSYKDAIAFLNNKYGAIPLPSGYNKEKASKLPNYEDEILKLDNRTAINYLENQRGFKHALEVVKGARVKGDDNYIYFPHYHFRSVGEQDTYIITDFQARRYQPLQKAQRYKRKGQTTLYAPLGVLSFMYETMNIVLCEGEIDTLSILDLKLDDAKTFKNLWSIALSGVANTNLLEQTLQDIPEDKRKSIHFLLAFDTDKGGEEAKRKVEEILEKYNYPHSTTPILQAQKGEETITYHDINEMMIEDRASLMENLKRYISTFETLESEEKTLLEKTRDDYFNKNTSKTHLNALLSDFTNKVDNLSITTNFEALDEFFKGVSKGVITLGALSSLGKTTLLLQIADQLASNNDKDILYFSLEQSGKELVSKSLSRLTYLNARRNQESPKHAKYSSSILSAKLDDKNHYKGFDNTEEYLLNFSISQYECLSNRLFIVEPKNSISLSIFDIENTIKEHIAITGNTPIVFIDYLQIIAPKDNHLSDKQAVDINISNLRRICSVYDLLVFAISSVGRSNYYSPIDMNSFKESGAIEYGSDILLGINFTAIEEEDNEKIIESEKTQKIKKLIKDEKSKSPRNVFIEVLKNRNGKSGERFYFHYYPEFNTFIELESKEGNENINPLYKVIKKLNELEQESLPF